MKICKICEEEKEEIFFPKWKKTCKKCCYAKNKIWKENNKKIVNSICIDCNTEYETITYSTEIINIRCRKCSIKSNKKAIINKQCSCCNNIKDIDEFYKNYKTCKSCLFKKRNKRYKERLNNDSLFKLKHNLKVNIRGHLKRINCKKNNKKTIEILGCNIIEFKIYLENKFEYWMTWENKGLYNGEFNYGWDIDHIIPISDAHDEFEILKLNHYSNLQPLCSKINRDIKKNKTYENKA